MSEQKIREDVLIFFQEIEELSLKPDFYEDFNPMSVFDPMFSSLPPDTISSNVPPSSRSSSSSSSSSSCSSLDTIELTEYHELRSGDGLASYLYDYSESLNSEELESELAQPQLSRMINSARAQKIILQERSWLCDQTKSTRQVYAVHQRVYLDFKC